MNGKYTLPRLAKGFWLFVTLVTLLPVGRAVAVDVPWTGSVGDGNWNTANNWAGTPPCPCVPEATFEEVAVINNGGTASISIPSPDAAGIVMGTLATDSGTLQILSGGSINFVDSNGAPTGTANIGLAGAAMLDVRGGGTMTTTLLDVNSLGNVILGSGTGVASLSSTGGIFLDGTTTVRGAGHTFAAAGSVTFEGNSVYVADVRSPAAHTPISAAGAVTLNGVFRPQFTGVTPSAGNRWDVIDATAINGAFTEVDFDMLPALPAGQVYRMVQTTGGTHGTRLQLGVDQLLTLRVNWDDKSVSIVNTGPAAVTIDGYSILSSLGALSPGTWNSLDDQNVGGANVWQEATPTANALNELNPQGTLTISGGQTRTLGIPFAPVIPSEFGVTPEDLVFEYGTSSNETVTGLVEYTGLRDTNNFRLTIDPVTGQGQLSNDGGISIALEGYSIQSESGALLTSWNSLDDQNVGGASAWQEANPLATSISELNPQGSTTLPPNTGYAIGNVWNTSGTRDLQLIFQLAGETFDRVGAVVYGMLPPITGGGLDGDYNNDGRVNAADYTLWRDNLGQATEASINNNGDGGGITVSDYTYWKQRFGTIAGGGSGGLAGSAAVPEPAAWVLFAIAGFGFVVRRPIQNQQGAFLRETCGGEVVCRIRLNKFRS